MGEREKPARSAADRAERVNVLQILMLGVVSDAMRDGVQPHQIVHAHIDTTLQTLLDLTDELREAKLERARKRNISFCPRCVCTKCCDQRRGLDLV